MLHSIRSFIAAIVIVGGVCLVTGCGGPENQVMPPAPDSQTKLDDYNKEMNQPSPGI